MMKTQMQEIVRQSGREGIAMTRQLHFTSSSCALAFRIGEFRDRFECAEMLLGKHTRWKMKQRGASSFSEGVNDAGNRRM